MKAQFFTKRGESGAYYRCGICRDDRSVGTPLHSVMVANRLVAIICPDCLGRALREVEAVAPHSFPELDLIGNLRE